nr:unnamed protein product [Callosobruchus analis]
MSLKDKVGQIPMLLENLSTTRELAARASQNLQIPLTVKVVLQNTRYVGTDMSCRVNYEKTIVVGRMKPWCSTEVFLMTQVLRIGCNGVPL